ncbi:diguanylate cyclase, partial [bacterium]|nr:diguanylate cyclase [bacterium]
LLPYTKLEEAGSVAQRLRSNVEAKHVDLTNVKDAKISEIQVTISVGVYEYKEGDEPQQLYTKADKALYYAKEHGRNKVIINRG